MVREVLAELEPKPGETFFDATVGSGGHAEVLSEAVGPEGLVIGCDRDEAILAIARDRLKPLGNVRLFHAPFARIDDVLDECGIERVSGCLFDLGLSSLQLDKPERGFSFMADAPLDMRMDPSAPGPTAADIVSRQSERDLADIFFRYGEERHARRIARTIVHEREREPIETTGRLAELVRRSVPRGRERIHPATRVFQALRIVVNDELGQLEVGLEAAARRLEPGGRMAVIGFHSLEDRIVKRFFRSAPNLDVLTRKPVTCSDRERHDNPRARSAKLRAARAVQGAADRDNTIH